MVRKLISLKAYQRCLFQSVSLSTLLQTKWMKSSFCLSYKQKIFRNITPQQLLFILSGIVRTTTCTVIFFAVDRTHNFVKLSSLTIKLHRCSAISGKWLNNNSNVCVKLFHFSTVYCFYNGFLTVRDLCRCYSRGDKTDRPQTLSGIRKLCLNIIVLSITRYINKFPINSINSKRLRILYSLHIYSNLCSAYYICDRKRWLLYLYHHFQLYST